MTLISFASAMENETVVDVAMWSDIHTTLVTAVVEADLAETLWGEGPFTVFAPTNAAFEKLPEGTVEMLLEPENLEMLQSILTYHVLPGNIMSSDLTQGLTAETLQWENVTFTHINNNWYINSSKISIPDLAAWNWVVHVIDNVIMPPMSENEVIENIFNLRANMSEEMESKIDIALKKYEDITEDISDINKENLNNRLYIVIDMYIEDYSNNQDVVNMLSLLKYEIMAGLEERNVVNVAVNSWMHSTLVGLVLEAELVEALSVDGPFTVFAPINEAFAEIPTETLESLSKDEITDILTYHVVAGAYMASDITDGLMLETLNGDSLEFSIDNGVVSINGMPTLVATDIVSSNGIVHVIDDVLIPGE